MQEVRRLADVLETLVQAGNLRQEVEDLQADRLGQEVRPEAGLATFTSACKESAT